MEKKEVLIEDVSIERLGKAAQKEAKEGHVFYEVKFTREGEKKYFKLHIAKSYENEAGVDGVKAYLKDTYVK